MRIRLKVYTDPEGVRWLAPGVFCVPGSEGDELVEVLLVRDDGTHEAKLIEITGQEWNGLPFYWFRREGVAADRPAKKWLTEGIRLNAHRTPRRRREN